jgi:hypothetical protein
MVAVIDAVRGALDDAQRQLERAQHLKHAVTAVAITALRQRELSDGYIGSLLDLDTDALAAAADRRDLIGGAQDWEIRAEIEHRWMAVRRQASVWMQIDEVTTSAQVVDRNGIDTGSWPLAVRALDTPGAEFIHQHSGQKIVVYSLQGRDGTPTIVNNAIASWDHQGEYEVEFVSPEGLRSPLGLTAFGVVASMRQFRRPSQRDELMRQAFPNTGGWPTIGRDATESFAALIAAIRRTCGPLPPYSELVATMTDEIAAH